MSDQQHTRIKHGVFLVPKEEMGMWQCDFDDCVLNAVFLVEDVYPAADDPDAVDVDQRGACWMHAQKWAAGCEGCSKKILNQVMKSDSG